MNVSRATQQYITEHPSVMDCLSSGIINYSSLSREICEACQISSFDAVLVALRRYFYASKMKSAHEKEILALMRGMKLLVRNRMSVIILEKSASTEILRTLQKAVRKKKGEFNLIEGENAITITANSEAIEAVKRALPSKICKITDGLVKITMLFDEKIENVSGVVSYIYSLLSKSGVNILEEMSCWTDLMILIEEKDMSRAMAALSVKQH